MYCILLDCKNTFIISCYSFVLEYLLLVLFFAGMFAKTSFVIFLAVMVSVSSSFVSVFLSVVRICIFVFIES